MVELPPIDTGAALLTGTRAVRPGPRVPRAEASAVVAGLRRALAASTEPALEATRLGVDLVGDEAVIDRATWVRLNLKMFDDMVGGLGSRAPRATLLNRIQGGANGLQLGGAFAFVAPRVLGQYLPYRSEGLLVLVAPNVAMVERELGVVPADFRLWVAVHERTHQLQFTRAPWLKGHLIEGLAALLAPGDSKIVPTRGAGLVGAFFSPEQRSALDRVSAEMALLEGYADVMMDRVGKTVVPTLPELRSRFAKRRAKQGWSAMVTKLLGFDLKLAQYRQGAAFCRSVIDQVGVDGLNAVYASSELLPSPEEIASPDRWVRRVHG